MNDKSALGLSEIATGIAMCLRFLPTHLQKSIAGRIAELRTIAARLAADQQKGGGEPYCYEVQWADGKTTYPRKMLVYAVPGNGCKIRALYTTPQPSSTAPAQQVVDEAMVERACIAYYEQPAWAFMSHKAACKDRMRVALTVALTHPPHADHKEPQG